MPKNGEEAHINVKNWTRRLPKRVFDYEAICVIVNPGLALEENDLAPTLYFLDSLPGVTEEFLDQAQKFLSGWLKREAIVRKLKWNAPKILERVELPTKTQENGFDCGVYCL